MEQEVAGLALVGCGEYLPPMEPVDRYLLGQLKKQTHVIFLPTAAGTEGEKRINILRERDTNPPVDLKFDINAHFLHHPGYGLLAKHVIYTQSKLPEQSCTEVIKLLS